MGVIYRKGKKYGGFFSGPAVDTECDTTGTIFKSTNVQGVIEEVSGIFSGNETDKHSLKNICVGTNPTTGNSALIILWDNGTSEQINYIDFTN